MLLFKKYGFELKETDEWYKDDLIIYRGIAQDSNNNFVVELYTLCGFNDVELSEKIIFRGEYDEMVNFIKGGYRDDQLIKLLN